MKTKGIGQELERRLENALRRLKNLYTLNGVVHLLLRLPLLIVLLFALDFSLVLPSPVRIVLAALAFCYLFYSFWKLLVYPLTRTISMEDMALKVESHNPDLDGRLISAIQLSGLEEDQLANRSPALMEATLEEARRAAEATSWERLFNTRRMRRTGIGAVMVIALLFVFCAWQPGLAAVGLSRLVGGGSEWPRKTTLLVHLESDVLSQEGSSFTGSIGAQFRIKGEEDPRGVQQVVVAEGGTLPLRIEVEGRDPGEVEVIHDPQDGRSYRSLAVRRGEKDYKFRVRDIREPMTLRVKGGDDSGSGREVEVSLSPLPDIRSTRITYRYPEYLRLDDETRDSAEIEAPDGTAVTIEAALTRPVARAEIRVITAAGESVTELVPRNDNGLVLSHSLIITSSGKYRIELLNNDGFKTLDLPMHPIICKSDQKPRIKLFYPQRKQRDVTPEAVIPIVVVAEDDYGVARIGFHAKLAGLKEEERYDFSEEEADGPLGSRRLVVRHFLDLADRDFAVAGGRRGLVASDSLLYALYAEDTRPEGEDGHVETGSRVIEVVTAGEKIRLLTERQIRLREKIKILAAQQEEKRTQVQALLSDLDEGAEVRERAFVSLQMGQNQMTSEYVKASREFAAIFDEYLFNRIDGTSGAETLLRRALAVWESAPPAESFNPALYRELVDPAANGDHGEMEVMPRLLAMMDLAFSVSSDLSPAAVDSLAGTVISQDGGERRKRLREAVDLQNRIMKSLDLLLEKMAEWEDFQELLQMWRDLVDDQDRLNSRTREKFRQ